MEYTVKEIAKLSGVTIKTLHHYHKIGLLVPCRITDAGYRLYGQNEIERLQEILFYRELDFPLSNIKEALEDESNRIECLTRQHEMLKARKQRMEQLLSTIEESIFFTKKGKVMDKSNMFKGLNKEEWNEALTEQKEYLKGKYNYEMETKDLHVDEMNQQAQEAKEFTDFMIESLKNNLRPDDKKIQNVLKKHIAYLNDNVASMDEKSFVNTAKFMIDDDFHRNMLEGQQIGLAYFLYAAANMHASH